QQRTPTRQRRMGCRVEAGSIRWGVVQEPACRVAGHRASGDLSAQFRISLFDAGIVSKDSFHFQITSFVRLKFQSLVDVLRRLGIFFLMSISERQGIESLSVGRID